METNQPVIVLPYFPKLPKLVGGYGAALILSYLELYCPARQDSPAILPITDLTRDLHLSRWNAWRLLSFISVFHHSEALRRAAALAGREFTRVDRRWNATAVKCFSLTAAGPDIYSLRRNHPYLSSVLQSAGCTAALAQWRETLPKQTTVAQTNQPLEAGHRDYFSSAPIDDLLLRRPEVVAAEVARSLNKISGLGDGRRRPGIKRAAYVRKPWSEDRRAKSQAMWAKLRAEKSVPVEDRGEASKAAGDVE